MGDLKRLLFGALLLKETEERTAILLDLIREDAGDLEWTYISPGGMIEPGERTGAYRVGGDQLLADEQGNSRISAEDYAIALIDELEKGEHIRRRINVAY